MGRRLRSAVLALSCLAALGFLAAPAVRAEEPAAGESRARWGTMPTERRDAIIRNYRLWRDQPVEARDRARKNYSQFRSLPPEEQQRLRDRFRTYRGLDTTGRRQVDVILKRVEVLPPDRKNEAAERARRLIGRPEDERVKLLRQSRFWRELTPQERQIFERLMFPE